MIRPVTLISFVAFIGSGLYLYQVKHQAQLVDRQIHKVQEATEAARARAGVLRAEYALLNDPDRLAELATAYVPDLKPTQPVQWSSMAEIERRLPPVGGPTAEPAPLEPDAPAHAEPPPMAARADPVPVARAAPARPPARPAQAVAAAPPAAGPQPIAAASLPEPAATPHAAPAPVVAARPAPRPAAVVARAQQPPPTRNASPAPVSLAHANPVAPPVQMAAAPMQVASAPLPPLRQTAALASPPSLLPRVCGWMRILRRRFPTSAARAWCC